LYSFFETQSFTLTRINARAMAPVTAVAIGATRLLSWTGQWQSVAVAFVASAVS
jgi:hypothetical protein